MPGIIEAEDLTKAYNDTVAVNHIRFFVKKGEVFGLLGPNGAGKTTTMRMIECVSPRTSGTLRVFGLDPEKNAAEQFGEMDVWMFTLGEYRLFLNPMTRRWYFFDRPHNYWKDIDAPAGTVVFSLRGSDLDIIRTSPDMPPANPAAQPSGRERRFCPQCGAPLKSGLKFCSSCGAQIT